MSKAVKRPYNSPRRAAQAQSTREAIRRAAHELFVAEGYAATPITAIALEAEVAPQTIYSQFGTKAAIVKELLDVSIAGDEEPIAVADRPWFTRIYDDGIDGYERLRRYAGAVRRIYEGAGSVFEIIRRGADSDSELAEVWSGNLATRRTVAGQIIDVVTADTTLRDPLSRDDAADLLWVLHGPEWYQRLVVECGWKADRYESWLAETFCEQLLVPRRRRAARPSR
jgi:AcrR family transcriptional regulator